MRESPIFYKTNLYIKHLTVEESKVSDLITTGRGWNINHLIHILPNNIMNKIKAIYIPISVLKDRLHENSLQMKNFQLTRLIEQIIA